MPNMDIPKRFDTASIAAEYLEKNDPAGWFEPLYQNAKGDATTIPWADQKPNPYLIEWLNANQVKGDGKRAIVLGCGLGDDAEELQRRGYSVTAFDISLTAIEWAKKRFTDRSVTYHVADLFDIPKEWLGHFDFVFESYTIQALPRSVRKVVIAHVASLTAPQGKLLIICRGWRDDQVEDALPWPLKKEELQQFETLGFSKQTFEEFWDYTDPERKRFRVLYEKS